MIIGCLGYRGSASTRSTEVYRLNLQGYSITRMQTTGSGPLGETHFHKAQLDEGEEGEERKIKVRTKEGQNYELRLRDMRWI